MDWSENFLVNVVGKSVIKTYAVLLLLDLQDSAILEGPPHDVGLLLGLDELTALQGRPEVVEVLDYL